MSQYPTSYNQIKLIPMTCTYKPLVPNCNNIKHITCLII